MINIKTKLTLHPKLEASKELLAIAKTLCNTDKDSFIGAFGEWEEDMGCVPIGEGRERRWEDPLRSQRPLQCMAEPEAKHALALDFL